MLCLLLLKVIGFNCFLALDGRESMEGKAAGVAASSLSPLRAWEAVGGKEGEEKRALHFIILLCSV